MVGQAGISGLRAESEKRRGYDVKRFHDRVLDTGRVSLKLRDA